MTLLHSKGHCWILHEQCSNAIIQQPDIPSQITAFTMQQFGGFFYQCNKANSELLDFVLDAGLYQGLEEDLSRLLGITVDAWVAAC
jgi:hypothetical protein